MTITALIAGRLVSDLEQAATNSGRPYVRATIDPGGDGVVLLSLTAFGRVGDQLAAMAKGDAIACTGRTKVRSWLDQGRNHAAGLAVTADVLLTAYDVRRKRAAIGQQWSDAP